MEQHTIKETVSLTGIGLHTGARATITLKPADAGTGVVFARTDLPGAPEVPAKVRYVVNTNRSTTIERGDARVITVEHLLAALAGNHIDNVRVEIDGPEVPIMDGTASPFVELIRKAGRQPQGVAREYFVVKDLISYTDEETGAEFIAMASDRFELTTMIDFDSDFLEQQFAELNDMDDFNKEIAPCRTFVFLREIESLADQGLIKGGDLDNAIVVVDQPVSQSELESLARKLGRPALEVSDTGILNTIKLKFKNEPARHKLLDVIGDLCLLGVPIQGKIVAKKPGHRVNTEFVRRLARHYQEQLKLGNKPDYDPAAPPLFTTAQIERILPHRHPFLLVDKIISLTDTVVVGIKNITYDQYFFKGHFPGNPIMPGVLQIEAMAQTGGVLALSTKEDPENWDTFFLKIRDAKFKHFVVPGDTMIIKMELVEPIRRGICHMRGTVYVGDTITTEADMTALIKRREPNDT